MREPRRGNTRQMTTHAAESVGERLAGQRQSRTAALMTSLVAGAVVTAVMYRWLRSPSD